MKYFTLSLDPINCNVNTLRLRQNACYFQDNIFKCIFLNENIWILINISLKFVSDAVQATSHYLKQLEQLEGLHSEIAPAAPWQIFKNCQKVKF